MVYSAHKSRFEQIMDLAAIDWDSGDPWGSAMSLFFDVAQVLHMTSEVVMESDGYHDHALEAFARWDYRPSPYVSVPDIEDVVARAEHFSEGEFADDYSWNVVQLASAVHSGEITQADLIYVGNVLDKYTNILRIAGKDY
jgi:hypothetical protein